MAGWVVGGEDALLGWGFGALEGLFCDCGFVFCCGCGVCGFCCDDARGGSFLGGISTDRSEQISLL